MTGSSSRIEEWIPLFVQEPCIDEWTVIWKSWSLLKQDIVSFKLAKAFVTWWHEIRYDVFFHPTDAIASAHGIRIPDGRDLTKWIQRIIRLAVYLPTTNSKRYLLHFGDFNGDNLDDQMAFLRTTFHKSLPVVMRELWLTGYAHVPSKILTEKVLIKNL